MKKILLLCIIFSAIALSTTGCKWFSKKKVTIAEHADAVQVHAKALQAQSEVLEAHAKALQENIDKLQDHAQSLQEHAKAIQAQTAALPPHNKPLTANGQANIAHPLQVHPMHSIHAAPMSNPNLHMEKTD